MDFDNLRRQISKIVEENFKLKRQTVFTATCYEVVICSKSFGLASSTEWTITGIIDKFDQHKICESVVLMNKCYKVETKKIGDNVNDNFYIFIDYTPAIEFNLHNLWYNDTRSLTLKFKFTHNRIEYEGEYIQGKKNGIWKSFSKYYNEIVSMGQYIDDVKVGLWYEGEDTIRSGVYIDGKKYGKWIAFYHMVKTTCRNDYYYDCELCKKSFTSDQIDSYDYVSISNTCDCSGKLKKIYKDSNEEDRIRHIKEGQFWHKYQPAVIEYLRYNPETKMQYNIGDYTKYHSNGKISLTRTYDENGNVTGEENTYDENGKLISTRTYKNNLLNGYSMYEPKGSGIIYKEYYVDDKLHGLQETFFASMPSRKRSSVEWENGKQTGNFLFYHGNGNKYYEGKKKNSFKVDDWIFYHEDGSISSCGSFESYEQLTERLALDKFRCNSSKKIGIWKHYRNKNDDITVRDPNCFWKIGQTEREEDCILLSIFDTSFL